MPEPIRVLVVDDSAFMRSALSRLIESDARFKIADTARDGREGVEKALRLRPDVVTLDVEMPVLNGIDALRLIVAQSDIPVIMVSAMTDDGARITLDALSIGAVDFIPKSKGAELMHEKLFAAAGVKRRGRDDRFAHPGPGQIPRPTLLHSPHSPFHPKAVVIGSSTGGPRALELVLSQLSGDLSQPVFVAQHMPQPFTSALARRLDGLCQMKVTEAKDGDSLEPSTVHVAPGGLHMRVVQGAIHIAPDGGESLYKPSLDVLMASVAETYGHHVLGIMLTGLGNDGTREFCRLRAAGGVTIAQDQTSSVVFGMPKSLIDAGGAVEVLPLEQIGWRISELCRRHHHHFSPQPGKG